MKLLIHCLLISCILIIIVGNFGCLSIIIAETFPTTDEIEAIIEVGQSHITGLPPKANLKLLKRGEVYRHDNVLLWKGTYNDNTDIAIKIFNSENEFEHEKRVYKRLNATDDPDIEKDGVARVYYWGEILENYFAIARTWCDETLEHRFNLENGNFSEATILLLFKQTAQALKYIHNKSAAVRDIGLGNIFIRDQDVFIGELNMADWPRTDLILGDYRSLLCSIGEMAGVTLNPNDRLNPDYAAIVKSFKDPDVREAFQFIVNIKNLDDRFGKVPNYDEIIRTADNTLDKISTKSGEQVQFDWLKKRKNFSPGESSKHRKRSK